MDRSQLPADRLVQPTTLKWYAAIVGFSLVYAIIRYHIAGDVPWQHFPLFIVNKATSLSAVIFVACSYLIGKVIHWHDDDKAMRLVVIKFCGLMGVFSAILHSLLSFALLSPAYFSKYFQTDGKLNLDGELAVTAGAAALILLMGPAITTLPMMPKALGGIRWRRSQRLGYAALLFVAVHLVFLGWKGWLDPSGWNGGLPPISLVALIVALIPIVVKGKRIRDDEAEERRRADSTTGLGSYSSSSRYTDARSVSPVDS